MVYGKSAISGTVKTGDVITNLRVVQSFIATIQSDTVSEISVNETLPLLNENGTVTVVTENNDETFYWIAIGTG